MVSTGRNWPEESKLSPETMGEIERRETTGLDVTAGGAPERRLASERVIINAPMSFAGAAQRAWRLGGDMTGPGRVALIALVIIPIILVWWTTILGWYFIFGLLLVPYRLLRRGARKRKAEALRHREMLDAVDKSRR